MFYSNFSTYHLVLEKHASSNNGGGESSSPTSRVESQDLELAKKYIHAAIQLTMGEMQKVDQSSGEAAAPHSKSGLRKSEIR